MLLVFAILLIIILVVLVRCIVIVPQSNAYVTEWLGVYKDTWGAGLHIRTPSFSFRCLTPRCTPTA